MPFKALFEEKLRTSNIDFDCGLDFNQGKFAHQHGVTINKGHCYAYVSEFIKEICRRYSHYSSNPDEILCMSLFASHEVSFSNTLTTAEQVSNTQSEYEAEFSKSSVIQRSLKFNKTRAVGQQSINLEELNHCYFQPLMGSDYDNVSNDGLRLIKIGIGHAQVEQSSAQVVHQAGHALALVYDGITDSAYFFDPNLGIYKISNAYFDSSKLIAAVFEAYLESGSLGTSQLQQGITILNRVDSHRELRQTPIQAYSFHALYTQQEKALASGGLLPLTEKDTVQKKESACTLL